MRDERKGDLAEREEEEKRQDSDDEHEERDEVHQTCGSGFVRPPLCLSFAAPRRTQALTLSYRLWQFPRRTL